MTELIKITEENGEQLVSLRELHSFLEIKTEPILWFKRMMEYGFEENKDFTVIKNENPVNKQVTVSDYALTLDCAKEVSMIQRTGKGRQARQYFIERDKKLAKVEKVGLQMPNFNNPAEAARAWADEYEQRQLAQAKVKELEPPAQYAKEVLDTENAFPITHIAKELGMSAIRLNKQLHELGVQHKVGGVWILNSKYGDKGYTKMGTTTFETTSGEIISSHHTYWTERGRKFIHELIS